MSSNDKGAPLQDPFLNAICLQDIWVSIYLVNGIKLTGNIESFDQYVVLLRNTVTQMVYKHAISTIVPARLVSIPKIDTESVVTADPSAPACCITKANDEEKKAQGYSLGI